MNVDIYNQENKKVGKLQLPGDSFQTEWKPEVVHRVIVDQMANKRTSLAHVKDRSRVRGGGKKPWRQKGTGRARAGSSRSPIWRGGGVTFGPTNEKKHNKKINKKTRKLALSSLLSKKFADGEVRVLDSFEISEPKTKYVFSMVKNLAGGKRFTALFIAVSPSRDFIRATRNIPGVAVSRLKDLNVYECLRYKYLFFEKEAVKSITSLK